MSTLGSLLSGWVGDNRITKRGKMRRVGSGKFVYDEVRPWGEFPKGWTCADVPAVAVDSEDMVYVLSRHKQGVVVFDREGHYVRSWGEDLFKRPHGIFVGPDDSVYCVDDWGNSIFKFTKDGMLLMTLETRDHPSDTGYVRGEKNQVIRAGPPFNQPTGVALSPKGELYITDGYGNARVHKFTPAGQLLFSWGEPGNGPGQFCTVHGVCVDKQGWVYISDRTNARVQIFNPQGELLGIWTDVRHPNNMSIDSAGNFYVAETGSVFLFGRDPQTETPPARITVRNSAGKVLSEWGEDDPHRAGLYFAPHGIAVDSRGDLYVGEVTASYNFGKAPADWGVLRKYILKGS